MTPQAGPLGVYVDGFLARCDAFLGPGRSRIHQPGLRGVLVTDDPSSTRVLVVDDRAIEAVPDLLGPWQGGVLAVLATAPRITDLLRRHDRWRGEPATAMVRRDLGTVSDAALPRDLSVRAVRRTDNDPSTDVALNEAVDLAIRAEASDESVTVESLSAHLRAMPPTVRLFAAVDREGSVRGTAGAGVFGRHAHLIFVSTDAKRRGQGIGRAMTTFALTDAHARGATDAYLDASPDGRRLYDAMGFETAAALTRFGYRA